MDTLKEAERIKDRLRSCKSKDEVMDVANEEREKYFELKKAGGFGPVMAIQIQNLKAYMIKVALKQSDV